MTDLSAFIGTPVALSRQSLPGTLPYGTLRERERLCYATLPRTANGSSPGGRAARVTALTAQRTGSFIGG